MTHSSVDDVHEKSVTRHRSFVYETIESWVPQVKLVRTDGGVGVIFLERWTRSLGVVRGSSAGRWCWAPTGWLRKYFLKTIYF